MLMSKNATKPRRILKFRIKKDHPLLLRVNSILETRLESARAQIKDPNKLHKRAKVFILAAIFTLRKRYMGKVGPTITKPNYIFTQEKITKLIKRIRNARRIQGGEEAVTKNLLEEAKMMAKLRMSPAQYIKACEDRVKLLEEELGKQKERYESFKTRTKFQGQPSMKSIGKKIESNGELDYDEAEKVYKELYTKKPDPVSTPQFDEWLQEIKDSTLLLLSKELEERRIWKMAEESLKTSALWKAPGQDQIPNAAYRMLPAAKMYLKNWITKNLNDHYKVDEEDVKGLCFLIYKEGDATNVLNYRPISLLNTDYKILTKVTSNIIKENLAKGIIPAEQLARENTWGTLHGLLLDKAYVKNSQYQRKEHYSAWYDFSKAYDSLSHKQILRLVESLNIGVNIKVMIKSMMAKWNIQLLRKDMDKAKTIRIKQGVYQGDSWSPLIFILTTAGIISKLKRDEALGKATKYKHRVIAFMDDLKVHSPNVEGLEMMSKMIKEGAGELSLKLNEKKCGFYSRKEDVGKEESLFIPRVRKGYKYLGITQLETDIPEENFQRMKEKYLERTQSILESRLTTNQKKILYNTAVIPAGIYVTGNLFPAEKVASTLLRCRKIDLEVRKLTVKENIKTRPTANARFYLPQSVGGLGFRSLEVEMCIQYIRKYVYLMSNTEVSEAKKIFIAINKGGCRNPISDYEHVRKLYKLKDWKLEKEKGPIDYRIVVKSMIEEIKKANFKLRKEDWSKAMTYPKTVLAHEGNISFPALKSLSLDSSKLSLVNASAEEQIFFLGKKASVGLTGSGRCRFGCQADETNYHVTSTCQRAALITRHDMVVWNVLKLMKLKFERKAFPNPGKVLQVGEASLDEEYDNFEIRAGASMLMEEKIKSNKPDIIIFRKEPRLAVVIEVSVPALKTTNSKRKSKSSSTPRTQRWRFQKTMSIPLQEG
uniref:Reverse transcriptase domain-containing protein n=1 Tax=Rhabditophanes sp. KR3021 TaxID=114890 RepID=A0AC35TX11_9BILA